MANWTIKICGITNVGDAELAVEAGADAIGINLVPESPRVVSLERAREITTAVGQRATVVGVVANLSADVARGLRDRSGVHELQLHGDEPRDVLAELLPRAFKALRIGSIGDVVDAMTWGGDVLLVDARVPGALGGTGKPFDWRLVRGLCAERHVLLAGGLTPDNVADAIAIARPYGVDVASGVEVRGDPRSKDPARLRAFVDAVRSFT